MNLPDWRQFSSTPSPLSVRRAAFALSPSPTFHSPDLSIASVEVGGVTVWIRRGRSPKGVYGTTLIFRPIISSK